MPFKTEKLKIDNAFLKRSGKLLPCQKEMVLWWHNKGESSRKLAARFKVSRRLIQFIVDPEKYEENLKRRQERGGSKQYYEKDKHAEAMKKHRRYKNDLFKAN
jgi:hypothetical protein